MTRRRDSTMRDWNIHAHYSDPKARVMQVNATGAPHTPQGALHAVQFFPEEDLPLYANRDILSRQDNQKRKSAVLDQF